MRIFFDTNIIMEYILERESFQKVDAIVKLVEKNGWFCFISSASLYTLAYTIEKYLKIEDKNSLQPRTKNQRIALLRQMLWNIVDMFNVVGLNATEARQAIENMDFDDIWIKKFNKLYEIVRFQLLPCNLHKVSVTF